MVCGAECIAKTRVKSASPGVGNDDQRNFVADCDGCKEFFKFIRQILASREVRLEVEFMAERMCRLLPGPQLVRRCQRFTRANLNQFLKTLSTLVKPHRFCQSMRLCPRNQTYEPEELDNSELIVYANSNIDH
ncbi:unnamed protein product [Echinostoma caproni]|uniref:Saposin B-type domain-containing protein n=1 Tax=Echinostoma caproni TaxID=27848 RepID=A0A183AZ11_9TREM|nr:unnamed protein product [Echinostoma caproni]